MPRQHHATWCEALHQLLDEIDRAVLAAGAADRYGQIAALVTFQCRRPAQQEGLDLRDQLGRFRLGGQVVDHRLIAPGQRLELLQVEGVGQHAHVEHEVGVHGHAMLVGEGFEYQRQARGRGLHDVADPGAQLRRAQQRGVDHGGELSQRAQQLALQVDGVDQGLLGGVVFTRQVRRSALRRGLLRLGGLGEL